MERRDLVKLLLASAAPFALPVPSRAQASPPTQPDKAVPDARTTAPLDLPTDGKIKAAFLISPGAEIVDFGGPWGVFEYVYVGKPSHNPFELYTVAPAKAPIKISGGMIVTPSYALADAPLPDIVVVPAMDLEQVSPDMLEWLRKVHATTKVTMSVCNGSFVLAMAGLLDGRNAAAHHGGFGMLRTMFPKVNVMRGKRWVEDGRIATSGGLTSGQDLALRVVERFFGRDATIKTARHLEYQGTGWMNPDSNAEFAQRPVSTPERPYCPVCEAELAEPTAFTYVYKKKSHMFCSQECKDDFVKTPERFLVSGGGIG
jgi:putative intracellular protease/amidase/YHS domain-containing protein